MTKARGRIYGRQRHDRYSGTLPSNVYMILRLLGLERESGKESDNQGERWPRSDWLRRREGCGARTRREEKAAAACGGNAWLW